MALYQHIHCLLSIYHATPFEDPANIFPTDRSIYECTPIVAESEHISSPYW